MNQVNLLGYAANDPYQTQHTGKSNPTLFLLAVKERFNKHDITQFVSCVAWGRMGQVVSEHVKKGGRYAVQGRIISKGYYQGGDGETKPAAAEVMIQRIWFLQDPKPKRSGVETDFVYGDPY